MGAVQDWITLELAIRIHNVKGDKDISEAGKRKLRLAGGILFAVMTLAFVAFSIAFVVSAQHNDVGYGFNHADKVFYCIGWLFLTQVIVMISLVIWLFVETQRYIIRERQARQDGRVVTHSLRRELCSYAIITVFFALSYIDRFFYNIFLVDGHTVSISFSLFTYEMVEGLVWLLEGLSMGVLMLFHYVNFKEGSLLKTK